MENLPLYNSRILNSYVEYLKGNYPEINLSEILEYSNIAMHELADEGHWFTQAQVNRFHEALVKVTDNLHVAREAGRHFATSKSGGILRQYVIGFLSPMVAYWMMEKVTANITRDLTVNTHKLASNKIEITFTHKPDSREQPFQCENRIGMLESLAKIFTRKYATVEHPECVHRDGTFCHYVVTWEKPKFVIVKQIASFFSLASVIASGVTFFPLPLFQWITLTLSAALLSVGSFFFAERLERNELAENIESQGSAADLLIDEINAHYNEAQLIQEIGQAASSILDIDKLLHNIMENLEKRLDFDRGVIMLANKEKTRLLYTVGYGYDQVLEDYLRNTAFHLDKPHSKGEFVTSFKEQKSFLVNDVTDSQNHFSPKTLEFSKKLGTHSFICVPIVYEGRSEGILAVDNIRSKKPFSQSDLSLLMGIAPQIGISINNARAYQLIREREESFRALSENAPDIIYTLNTDGSFTYVNPAWEKSLGHTSEEVIGKYFIDFARKDDTSTFIRAFKKIRDGRETIINFTSTLLHKNGSERLFNMTGAPNLDSEGNVLGLVGTFKDVTEQHHLEMQLRQSHKMQAIGTLSGGIAHDFNNILTPIMGYTELMLSEVSDDSQIKWMLERVYNASHRAKDLVQQILTFSRQSEQEKKPVQVSIIVKETLKLLRSSLPATIDIRHNIQSQSLVMGDPTQIHQVIMNLCTNAGYAMQQTGGILEVTLTDSISDKDALLPSTYTQRGAYMQLTVTDTGEGMTAEIMERIFDPFFTTKERTKGTGMGLSVVHGIVENHDSTITVESEPGKGSTFRVLFPIIDEAVTLESTADMAVVPEGRERILFIDDELPIIDIGKQILESLGYDVTTRTSSIEALELFKVRPDFFDLIITDMTMPNMTGESLARNLLNIRPDIPIIICTGYSASMTREKVGDMGINAIVMKPIIKKDIAHTIRQVLDADKEVRYAVP